MPNHVRFFKHPVLQSFLSKKEGRPIYKDTNYIEIQIPGQKNQVVKREVQDKDKTEYAVEWNNFDDGGSGGVGSPIDHLPGITPSKVMEMQSLGIHSIEQLVGLSETGIQKLGHGARAFIKTGEQYLGQTSEIDEVREQNEALAKQNRDLSAKVDMMMEQMKQITDKKPARKRSAKQLANDERLRNARKPARKAA